MKRLADLPLGLRILVGLVFGACVGVLLPGPGAAPWSDGIANIANTAGKLWLSALQMTVLPIVFALLTIGLGRTSGTAGTGDSVARRAVFVFAALYLFSLIVAVMLNQLLLDLWPVSAEATAAFGK